MKLLWVFFTLLVVVSVLITDTDAWRRRRRRRRRRHPHNLRQPIRTFPVITIPFGKRKRRDISDEDVICTVCPDIQKISNLENVVDLEKFQENYQIAMLAKYEPENSTKKKFSDMLTFIVQDVLKKPDSVDLAETFTIDPYRSNCTCLDILEEGMYLITGRLNQDEVIEVAGTTEIRTEGVPTETSTGREDDLDFAEEDDVEDEMIPKEDWPEEEEDEPKTFDEEEEKVSIAEDEKEAEMPPAEEDDIEFEEETVPQEEGVDYGDEKEIKDEVDDDTYEFDDYEYLSEEGTEGDEEKEA